MLTDEELARIRRDVEDGVRGPVIIKYLRLLLDELERWRGRRQEAPGTDDPDR